MRKTFYFIPVIFILLLTTVFYFSSCKKTDLIGTPATANQPGTERFFSVSATASPEAKAIAAAIKRQDAQYHFLPTLIANAGYPVWDKIKIANITTGSISGKGAAGSGGEVVYVPFVLDSQEKTNAVLAVKLSADTIYRMMYANQYKSFGYDTADHTKWNVRDVFHLFTLFDNSLFGYKEFLIKDSLLFPIKANSSTIVSLVKSQAANTNAKTNYQQEICNIYTVCEVLKMAKLTSTPYCFDMEICTSYGGGGGGTGGGSSGGIGSGGPSGGTGGGTGGGSSGGIGSGGPPSGGGASNPCGTGRMARAPGGCGTGWEPVKPTPRYVCTYQMSQHEKDVFSQLDREDQTSDNAHQSLDCQGTKRTGNVYFQGTKEHWMIQLDYVSKNKEFGDVEFAIPGGSGNVPGNRGYADMVNTLNGNIFEIKPNNPQGLTAGVIEVANYVLKANENCRSTLSIPAVWNPGSNYATTLIPTSTQGKFLEAELIAPGVIGYRYLNTIPSPVPVPLPVPSSITEKFKHLIDRLKGNLSNADQIMSEYFQQDTALLKYIKAAAIGAGVAIVVGTLLEDVITAGVGIADDWACFVAAFRIVRFGLAL